jgi:hypothetical protein
MSFNFKSLRKDWERLEGTDTGDAAAMPFGDTGGFQLANC